MLSSDPEIQAQLDAGEINFRQAIRFDLDSGSYGFVDGYRGKMPPIDGVSYVGSGGLIGIEHPEQNVSPAGGDVSVTLASHYKINGEYHKLFEPHVLDSIEQENWFRRTVRIYRFWFDKNRRFVASERRHLREIQEIEHKKADVGRVIVAHLGAPSDFAKVVEGKIAGPELQSLIDPTDTSARHVQSAASDKIYFGRLPPNPIS